MLGSTRTELRPALRRKLFSSGRTPLRSCSASCLSASAPRPPSPRIRARTGRDSVSCTSIIAIDYRYSGPVNDVCRSPFCAHGKGPVLHLFRLLESPMDVGPAESRTHLDSVRVRHQGGDAAHGERRAHGARLQVSDAWIVFARTGNPRLRSCPVDEVQSAELDDGLNNQARS